MDNTKESLYDTEKRIVEESIADRPDHCVTDGDWREVEDPTLKLELLARYLRQEYLWQSPEEDHKMRHGLHLSRIEIRLMVEAMEGALNA